LLAVSQTHGSQRDVAQWLGQSEPSTSRMVAVLAEQGLLQISRVDGTGNRRCLRLTSSGAELVGLCGRLLDGRFEALVQRSGASYESLQRHTRRLLRELEHPSTSS
jgi:DNA-binding MarR family transcriptional regulator